MIKYTAVLVFLHDSENWATRFLLTLMVFYSRKLDGKLKNIKKKLIVGLEYYVQHYRGLVRQIKWRLMHKRA